MARIQFDDVDADDGEMLVYGMFGNGEELVEHGDQGLAEVLCRMNQDGLQETKAVYDSAVASGLAGFSISFDVDETSDTSLIAKLQITLEGRVFEFGS
jgi:hypothetical protein